MTKVVVNSHYFNIWLSDGLCIAVHLHVFLHKCVSQLKEFQQKSSPAPGGGEKGGGGGAGAKKKRKMKGQTDATSADRDSPDTVSL